MRVVAASGELARALMVVGRWHKWTYRCAAAIRVSKFRVKN